MLAAILLVCVFLHYGGSQLPQEGTKRVTPLNNNSLNLILGDQCVTREEVQAELESQKQAIISVVRNEINSLAAEITQQFQSAVDNCTAATPSTPTTQPTTEKVTPKSTTQPTTDEVTTQEPTTSTSVHTCNGTPGWRRVVYIDMTNTSTVCPQGLRLTSYSKRTCGRAPSFLAGCSSSTLSVRGSQYSQVCGRIRGYQKGGTEGLTYHMSIDSHYVSGVSLTHGTAGSRQHIWTFANGFSENDDRWPASNCPCDTYSLTGQPPPFVGNDYFCESGLNARWPGSHAFRVFYHNDPLWDGQGCLPSSTCCQLNNPPWFTKTLPSSTTDDIELRVCNYQSINDEDTSLELIELYVK